MAKTSTKRSKADKFRKMQQLQMKLFQKEEPLRKELKKFVGQTTEFGLIFHHPFYNSMIDPNHAALVHYVIDEKQKAVQKFVTAKKWDNLLALYEGPFLLKGFVEHAHLFDDDSYWRLLAHVWTEQEFLWKNQKTFLVLFKSPRPQREALMDKSELSEFRKLKDEFSVHRGFSGRRGKGMSWTIDKAKAVWFAKRFAAIFGQPKVASGIVSKTDVLAYFNQRGESEVVVDPTSVKKQKIQSVR